MDLASFYPEIKPYDQRKLAVSNIHTLFIQQFGNPEGLPLVVVHGGPGGGTPDFFAQYFDPIYYRIIFIDQRGAGQSTPKGEIKENNTELLIQDMETVRELLNIQSWVLFGGSWGSTLSLLYAEAHPSRVAAMILRGVFLARDRDSLAFTSDGCLAAKFRGEWWAELKNSVLFWCKRTGLSEDTSSGMFPLLNQLISHPDPEVQREAAVALALWEYRISRLHVNDDEVKRDSRSPDGLAMGRIETHYLANRCFIAENQILDNIDIIKNKLTYIVQGVYDLVCPRNQADELEKHLTRVIRFHPESGHASKEPQTIDAIVRAGRMLLTALLAQ